MKYILKYEEFLSEETGIGIGGGYVKPKVVKDEVTDLPTMDKTRVPVVDQLKVLAKDLYHTTIDMGRSQSLMMDKISKLQGFGADETMVGQMQQLMQDQMMSLQTKQGNLEMHMMNVAGQNPMMAQKAQQLSSEAKFLADMKNSKWFNKRSSTIENDVIQQLVQQQKEQKEKEEEKKQKEKEKKGSTGDKDGSGSGESGDNDDKNKN